MRPKARRATARAGSSSTTRARTRSRSRREDDEGDRVVADRAVRRPDRHRVRQGDRPHLLGLRQDVGRASTARRGKVVATIANGDGVDALGWDPSQKLIYIPGGARRQRDRRAPGFAGQVHRRRHGATMRGAKTIAVDPVRHVAYLFQPEYGPAPPNAPPDARGRPAAARWWRAGSSRSRTDHWHHRRNEPPHRRLIFFSRPIA